MARMHAEGELLFRVLVGVPTVDETGFVGRPEVFGPYTALPSARAQRTRETGRYRRHGLVGVIESTPVAWEVVE